MEIYNQEHFNSYKNLPQYHSKQYYQNNIISINCNTKRLQYTKLLNLKQLKLNI